MICELDRSLVDSERAGILAAELLVWWEQVGRDYYGHDRPEEDEGLRMLVVDAVAALGGPAGALRTLRSAQRTGAIA